MSTQNLSRMGAAKVKLIVDQDGNKVVEKCPVTEVEYSFYQHAATPLHQAGIASPEVLFADPSLQKLRIEYIPHAISQDDVAGDAVLSVLARLHGYRPDSTWVYHHHSWSETALENALTLLALPEKSARQMRCFKQCSDVLFSPQCLISGDSNAGNWGKRDNGDVVLFDWERFGTGSPAIDLAPLIKGMGTLDTITELAGRYCDIAAVQSVNKLAREIAIAKAWIVTEVVLLLNEREKSDFPFYLNWYRDNLPGWLNSTVNIL